MIFNYVIKSDTIPSGLSGKYPDTIRKTRKRTEIPLKKPAQKWAGLKWSTKTQPWRVIELKKCTFISTAAAQNLIIHPGTNKSCPKSQPLLPMFDILCVSAISRNWVTPRVQPGVNPGSYGYLVSYLHIVEIRSKRDQVLLP